MSEARAWALAWGAAPGAKFSSWFHNPCRTGPRLHRASVWVLSIGRLEYRCSWLRWSANAPQYAGGKITAVTPLVFRVRSGRRQSCRCSLPKLRAAGSSFGPQVLLLHAAGERYRPIFPSYRHCENLVKHGESHRGTPNDERSIRVKISLIANVHSGLRAVHGGK